MRRRSVIAFVALAVAVINAPAIALVAWVSIRDSGGGYLAIPFILIPCFFLSLGVGLFAALGAHVGYRLGGSSVDRFVPMLRASRVSATVGAAVGTIVGGAPLFGYLVWLFQNSAGVVGGLTAGYFAVTALLTWFAWFWCRPRV